MGGLYIDLLFNPAFNPPAEEKVHCPEFKLQVRKIEHALFP